MNERHAKWHLMTAKAVCDQLHTDAACGISRKAARSRFKKEGANTLFDTPKLPIWAFFKPLLLDPACLLMLFAALLSLCFAALLQGITVLLLILSLASFIFYALQKALSTEERIAKYRVPTVRVLRECKLLSVSARRIVAGDILLLHEGDIVPCDCRLLGEKNLRVMTLMRNDEGKTVLTPLPKNADTVYAYGTPDMEPYYENMLFGGSEILSGEACAIAVETGENCYVSTLPHFSIPAEMSAKQTEKHPWHAILPYIRLYGFGMLILLAVLSIVGIFRLPSQYGIMEIFLALCVLTGCASPAILEWWFRLIGMRGRTEALDAHPKEQTAVIKSERAMERLREISDVFVMGHLASSDGVAHFSAAAVGNGLIHPEKDRIQPLLQPLCEAFFLLKMAEEDLSVTLEEHGDDDTAFLSELAEFSGLDLSALRVRLISAHKRPDRAYGRVIDVTLREREFSLCFSHDSRILLRCMHYEDGNRLMMISPRLRDQLQGFCKQTQKDGGKPVTVLRLHPDGTCSLVGIVAIREQMQQTLPSVLEELQQSGIRTTFFFTGEPAHEAAYADACRIPGGRLMYDGATAVTVRDLEENRVLIGYSLKDAERLLADLRASGRRVAFLGGGVEDLRLLKSTSLLISCDSTSYDKKSAEESALEHLPTDGQENSARCAQVIRRRADILIHRASEYGGGLSSVLRTISIGRAAKLRMRWLLSGLIFSQAMMLCVTVLSILFGIGIFGGAQMLYASLGFELIFTLSVLTLRIPQYLLRQTPSLDGETVERMLFSRRSSAISAWIAGGITTLYAGILVWCGLITPNVASTYLFISLILAKLVGEALLLSKDVLMQNKKMLLFFGLSVLIPVLLMIAPAVLFSAVNIITGVGEWSLVTALSLPLMPGIVLLIKKIPDFFHRTAK